MLALPPLSPLPPLSHPAPRAAPRRRREAPGLLVVDRDHPRRAATEGFIRRVYAEHYGAEVHHFAPQLVALHGDGGEIVAAAGYRCAADEPLFLERYLAAPVETLLAAAGRPAPERGRIVEVGHLAGGRAGAGRRLIGLLAPHLAGRGFHWVVGTLTEELRQLFARLGIVPLALGVADPAALGADAAAWGSYYDHRPLVLAGPVELALQSLVRRSLPS
jgi:hypothetical protein